MSKYDNLSIEDLFEQYVINDQERDAIDEFALSLPGSERNYFLQLKRRNAVGIGLEPSPFEEIKNIKLFKTDSAGSADVDFIIYDPDMFLYYKAYIDGRVALEKDNPVVIPYLLDEELKRSQGRLEALKQELPRLLDDQKRFNANIALQQEVEKSIAYVQNLTNTINRSKLDTDTSSPKKGVKIVNKVWALYYYYLIENNYLPNFDSHKEKSIGAYKEIAQNHGIKNWKRFQLDYLYLMRKVNRVHKSEEKNIKVVIDLLEEYPAAQKAAMEELKIIQIMP